MKKEMKFRAWIHAEQKMSMGEEWFMMSPDGEYIQYAEQGYWSNNLNACEEHKEYLRKRNIEITDDFVLMRYTGLTDRDGQEIWEGDLREIDGRLYKVVDDGWQFRFERNLVEFGENRSIVLDEDTGWVSKLVGHAFDGKIKRS